ncbi:cytochrome P450 [Fomes fomentarius]|nr:cytochrome P450 [Fomes fomentarius]
MPPQSLLLFGGAFAFLLIVLRLSRRKNLSNLRGPPSPSMLFGNEFQLFHSPETGELDFQWMREYGATWRTRSYFSVDQIMTVDPKALQHILHKSGYSYPKRLDMIHMSWLSFGPGIIWSEGAMHRRHRKVMTPAFSTPQLRAFVPLFQRSSRKVIDHWRNMVADKPGGIILVNDWLARSALDTIGEAAFDYNFGAIDDAKNILAEEYKTLNVDARLFPDATNVFYRATWQFFPQWLLKLTKYTPGRVYARFRHMKEEFAKIGKPLYNSSAKEGLAAREKTDVMSVLIKANASENEQTRLGEDEVIAQMANLTVAGQETTSGAISWLLWELAQRPEYQARVRAEIRAARAQTVARGDVDFTLEDLDGMKVMLAAIKETLRFHPIAYHLWRIAAKDDIIPLSEPVIGKDGNVLNEIPIAAGQAVTISIAGYNRLQSVWGEDADKWDPERFFRLDADKQVKVGVYANLMSFSAGVRACIGWRFAMYQMQAVAAELLGNFEFAMPEDNPHIIRTPGGGVMIPFIKGQEEQGPAIPLRVWLST